ncbi:hypothetical protein HHK36_028719 [Tetracentron sinense]|uniref:Uncharacterized protein n=1 Tax=Tetracentron sinense TaxID=13715 RepID=A0A835D2W0_TETSI|nr:hypothetical protein HHK36_028719 [Tetracentron sinense]
MVIVDRFSGREIVSVQCMDLWTIQSIDHFLHFMDPYQVTYRPGLQAITQDTSSSNDHQPESENHGLQTPETDGGDTSKDNSCSPPENCSGDESRSLGNSGDDDPLMSSLWGNDTPLVDASWKFPAAGDGLSSWEDNCAWLLDYQDFGVEEFGFGCFNDMDMNTLEMGEKHYNAPSGGNYAS